MSDDQRSIYLESAHDEDYDDAPVCQTCQSACEWDSGDSSVGWPGAWLCPVCDSEEEDEDGGE
jgi:hypothetical protein